MVIIEPDTPLNDADQVGSFLYTMGFTDERKSIRKNKPSMVLANYHRRLFIKPKKKEQN